MNEDIIQYITAIENPDSVGFDFQKRIWTQPTQKGFDRNQIGIGLDKHTNKTVRDFLSKKGREQLTEQEERQLREKHINGYITDVWNKYTKGKLFSDKKKAIAYGLLYHGYGKSLWNDKNDGIYNAFWNGSDNDFEKAVTDFYNQRHPTRANLHQDYWKKKRPRNNIATETQHTEQPDALRVRKPLITHKQGGTIMNKLISRNPIQRFKLGKGLKIWNRDTRTYTTPSQLEQQDTYESPIYVDENGTYKYRDSSKQQEIQEQATQDVNQYIETLKTPRHDDEGVQIARALQETAKEQQTNAFLPEFSAWIRQFTQNRQSKPVAPRRRAGKSVRKQSTQVTAPVVERRTSEPSMPESRNRQFSFQKPDEYQFQTTKQIIEKARRQSQQTNQYDPRKHYGLSQEEYNKARQYGYINADGTINRSSVRWNWGGLFNSEKSRIGHKLQDYIY